MTSVADRGSPAGAPGTGVPACPGPEHQARELLNRVALLAQCLQLPDVTEDEWLRWPAEIAEANRRLDALYADGLRRDFLDEPPGRVRHPQHGNV